MDIADDYYLSVMGIVDFLLYAGTFVFALTGALKARAHRMDLFGGLVLAFATAYGGGTLRDLLIGIRPVGWLNDYIPLVLVAAATGIVFLFRRNMPRFEWTLLITDAIGLGLFTIGGIERSLNYGIKESYAVVLGVMSATFGGLVADLLSARPPALLQNGELYATAAAIGGGCYVLMISAPIPRTVSLFVCVLLVVAIRLISRRRKLRLPQI